MAVQPLPTIPRPAPAPEAAAGEPQLLALGVDYRTSPLDVRQKVSLKEDEAERVLSELMGRPEVSEAYLLSTCNRTEIYLRPRDRQLAYRDALDLVFRHRAPEIETEGRIFVYHDHDAARHLLSVAAGLESMVLGEPEILGQVKQATDLANGVGSAGPVIKRLLRAAQSTGKRSRRETEIGAGAVSVGYALVELSRQIFGEIGDRTCLVLGAGEIATVAARALTEKGVGRLLFANRDPARAESFLREFPQAEHRDIARRYLAMEEADVVVACTGATEPLLVAPEMAAAMRRRRSRTLLAVDLGVPRNIDPAVGRLDNVFAHDMDSLEHIVKRNLERRRTEVPKVEAIVTEELHRFVDWHRGLEAEPLVRELQKRAEEVRRREVDAVRNRFPEDLHGDLDRLTRALVRKILHHPSVQLRANGDRDLAHLEIARELFQLGHDDEETRP